MSDQFHLFAAAVHANFVNMSKGELFVVDITGDVLYDLYQRSFPEGTNEVFRKQREHECSTCRQFIKNIGNVVSIQDGQVISVWNVGTVGPYIAVAAAMDKLITKLPIISLFRTTEPTYGKEFTLEDMAGTTHRWNHFHAKIDTKHYAKDQAATIIGKYNTNVGVFKRGLEELTHDSLVTVAELIQSNNLYRGQESAFVVGNMLGLQSRYNSLKTEQEKNHFLWSEVTQGGALIRNTAIGTLLQDLSANVPLEQAVKSFEDKVSGTNYKRPTALITPSMVNAAMKTINELGIEPSLHRRLANATDLSVNNVLYVDNDVRSQMKGGVAGLLADAAVIAPVKDAAAKAKDISIDEFMATVLPKAKTMEVLVSNAHQSNFMTITAPLYADSTNLFKWDNGFGWSYDGNITDSIKERVKAAGGDVNGAMRISLAWFNHDDLDLHVIEPRIGRGSAYELYFGNKGRKSPLGGMLDVDMNMGRGTTRTPVENVVYDRLTDGEYQVNVENYSKRETNDAGFTIELAVNGQTTHYSSKTSPASGQVVRALVITIKNGAVTDVRTAPTMIGTAFSQEKWGVKTEQFNRVDTLLLSPNHWDGQATGNKHYFFILDGCKTDVPARGIYNEFLKPEFDVHRKVFEVLGNKMMCDPVYAQLSGVGFSSTKKDKVVIKVNHQLYNVQF